LTKNFSELIKKMNTKPILKNRKSSADYLEGGESEEKDIETTSNNSSGDNFS